MRITKKGYDNKKGRFWNAIVLLAFTGHVLKMLTMKKSLSKFIKFVKACKPEPKFKKVQKREPKFIKVYK